MVLRALKHLVNRYMRECESDELMASTISHLLNTILAPKEFIKRLDEGTIKFQASSLKEQAERNLLDNIKKLDGPTAAAEAVLNEQEKQPISKKEKKR